MREGEAACRYAGRTMRCCAASFGHIRCCARSGGGGCVRPRVVPGPLLLSYAVYLYHWRVWTTGTRGARACVHLGHNVSLLRDSQRWHPRTLFCGAAHTRPYIQWVTAVEPMHACACSRVSEKSRPQRSRPATLCACALWPLDCTVLHTRHSAQCSVGGAAVGAGFSGGSPFYDVGRCVGCFQINFDFGPGSRDCGRVSEGSFKIMV